MKKFFEWIISLTGIAVSILLVASWLSGFVNPVNNWIVSILALTFPYIFLIAIPIACWGLIIKNVKTWVLIALLILTSTTFRKSFFNQSITVTPSAANSFSLITHNIGSSLEGNQRIKWSFYKNADADILCFQEWHLPSNARPIKDSLIQNYNSTLNQHPNPWPIFTKYTILQQGEIRSKAIGNGMTWADVLYKKDTIRIYNVHLVSNRISNQTESLMNGDNLRKKNIARKVMDVMKRYRNALKIRVEQTRIIKAHINTSPHPVILAGDFNDIPSSYVYRYMQKGLYDSFFESGSGMAYTYAGKLPFLHIDHVLYDQSFDCNDIQIKRVNYSDHFPVKVWMTKK
jgi:endonuclease/exonuclease/phosphatase family metal-dependent hydrolase